MRAAIPIAVVFAATATAAALAAPGERHQQCYGNGTCNAGLSCVDNVCVRVEGSPDQPCYGNNTCNAGFKCVSGICRAGKPECEPTPEDILEQCEDKAVKMLRSTYSSSAPRRAEELCRGVVDVAVLEAAYQRLKPVYGFSAGKHAIDWAKKPQLKGKAAVIDACADVLKSTHGLSAGKYALEAALSLSSASVGCIRKKTEQLRSTRGLSAGKDAIEKCKERHPHPRCD